jgi:hypothetical protein
MCKFKTTDEEFEKEIFEVVLSLNEADDQSKFGGLLFLAQSLAMHHYTEQRIANGEKQVDVYPFYLDFCKDLKNEELPAEDMFDKYFRKGMKEEHRNKTLEMITFLRSTRI